MKHLFSAVLLRTEREGHARILPIGFPQSNAGCLLSMLNSHTHTHTHTHTHILQHSSVSSLTDGNYEQCFCKRSAIIFMKPRGVISHQGQWQCMNINIQYMNIYILNRASVSVYMQLLNLSVHTHSWHAQSGLRADRVSVWPLTFS